MRTMILCAWMSGYCAPSSRVGAGGLLNLLPLLQEFGWQGIRRKGTAFLGKSFVGCPLGMASSPTLERQSQVDPGAHGSTMLALTGKL